MSSVLVACHSWQVVDVVPCRTPSAMRQALYLILLPFAASRLYTIGQLRDGFPPRNYRWPGASSYDGYAAQLDAGVGCQAHSSHFLARGGWVGARKWGRKEARGSFNPC